MQATSVNDSLTSDSTPASTAGFTANLDVEVDAEEQPLLCNKRKRTPLPKRQLAIICLCRLAEPIAYSQIFPYINQMVEELHVTKKSADIGFYSGLVDGLFACAQLLTIFQWGRLSDRIGRKPVIISGLTGVALASSCFGLSTKFWHTLVFRAMAGGLTGNVAVIESVLGEITDETNQAQAFPLAEVTWSIGCVVGPLIGGYLSHPAERYPDMFGHHDFLRQHPYFLPCFVSSMITLCSIIITVIFLEETLPSKVAAKLKKQADQRLVDSPEGTVYGAVDQGCTITRTQEDKPAPSAKELLSNQRICNVLTVGFFLSFLCVAWETVFVLFAYTPTRLGGLERSPAEIGSFLSILGVLGMFLSLIAFPTLQHRFDTLPLYRACMACWPIIFVLFSATSIFARLALRKHDGRSGEDASALAFIWIGVSMILLIGRIAAMGFATHMIMVKASAPTRESLGATFGLSQSMACVARAVGPAFVSSLFALSIDKQILGGHFVWLVMFGIAVLGYMATRRL
ncbi:hypothetical protein FRB93_011928 [Tulasnella sp. JGI-2019a]|nr:hypothetical protein FRB93_011928 [Tulasnella sp. JGI-2019a]